jgi:predicted transposase/invertase (TIGR01784 family)
MNYIYTILSYIVEAGELDKQEFIQTVKTGLTQEVNIMTLAEQFKQEGRQEGYQKGIALVEQKKREVLKAVAIKLFNQGQTAKQISIITGLTSQEVDSIKKKIKRH